MASLSARPNKTWMVQFAAGASRRSFYLPKMSRRNADAVVLRVDALIAAKASGVAWDADLAAWVGACPDDLRDKLAGAGLVPPRPKALTVAAFLADYLDRRRAEGRKPATVAFLKEAGRKLTRFIADDAAALRSVTPDIARRFRAHLLALGTLSSTTIARTLTACGTIFKAALEDGQVDADPFAKVRVSAGQQDARREYAPAEDLRRVIGYADPAYRLVLALARFGGLRCPNEVLSLRWEHVDLAEGG